MRELCSTETSTSNRSNSSRLEPIDIELSTHLYDLGTDEQVYNKIYIHHSFI